MSGKMDRNKNPNPTLSTARGPKSKLSQQPPEMFIALGAKQSTSRDDPKRSLQLQKPSSSATHLQTSTSKGAGGKLKREVSASTLSASSSSKKLKLGTSVSVSSASSSASSSSNIGLSSVSRSSHLGSDSGERHIAASDSWESQCIECESSELIDSVVSAMKTGKNDRAICLILGAIRTIRLQRHKMCKILYSSLLLLGRLVPQLFRSDQIVLAIVGSIRKDINSGVKPIVKPNIQLHVLLTNIVVAVYMDQDQWHDLFIKLYVEDAVADRILLDNPYCKPFIENLATAFNTKFPPQALLKSEAWSVLARDTTSSPLTINMGEDDSRIEGTSSSDSRSFDGWKTKVRPRYTNQQENVEKIVLEVIKEQLVRKSQPETITKNFVRFLSVACGLVEIRIIAVARIETWLHNHKLMKPAQELLAYLCYNCSAASGSARDLEIIAQLSKLRLKSKPMVNYFNNCLREMVCAIPENLYPLLKYTIYNELSNARNPNNLLVVGALFQVKPEASANAFCDICVELLFNKDDYLRPLRALLKEINRVLRYEFNLLCVVRALLHRDRKEWSANAIAESDLKDRIFLSLVDLVAMMMLLSVSPHVREAATHSKRDTAVLKLFQQQVSLIQMEAIHWLYDSAIYVFRPNVSDYHHAIYKVMLLEQPEHYYKVDQWPGENERLAFLRLVSEVPCQQVTLQRLLQIGISREHPVNANEVLDVCDQLVRKCANLPQDLLPPLHCDNTDLVELFFRLCVYNYPENIQLPAGYQPPNLAIANLYWKTLLVLVIIVAHNPQHLGEVAWSRYPILKMLMEMCITNQFSYPPPTMTLMDDDLPANEPQLLMLEKQKILEFETHLAAASTKVEINEQTSLLLSQLVELRPEGPARRPPTLVLDQLSLLNSSHRLGHFLCRSRQPDFLLDIMSRQQQGSSSHMPWLADLVLSSDGNFDHLPVQCLCEYLLSVTQPVDKIIRQEQLLRHLKSVVYEEKDTQTGCEVLEYLFRRLTSDHGASRQQTITALNLILATTGKDPEDIAIADVNNSNAWLTNYIQTFPRYDLIKPMLVQFLRQALQIETNPARVSSYINYLTTTSVLDGGTNNFTDLHELVVDLAAVVIERHSVASYILPGTVQNRTHETLSNLLRTFRVYIDHARHTTDDTLLAILQQQQTTYGTSAEYVLIVWQQQKLRKSRILTVIIHATIILLTYGPMAAGQRAVDDYHRLLDDWFPANKQYPLAYDDEQQLVSYLPDWMKLRMIRSNVDRLVDAALDGLEPAKLILFLQSFGVSTGSVSKLLQMLDAAIQADAKSVVDAVLDKSYMIQLVQVQNRRGALGGHVFLNTLKSFTPLSMEQNASGTQDSATTLVQHKSVVKRDHPIVVISKMDANNSSTVGDDQQLNSEQNLVNLLNLIFTSGKDEFDLIMRLIKCCDGNSPMVHLVFKYLRSAAIGALVPTLWRYACISRLFHVLFECEDLDRKERIGFAIDLVRHLANKQHPTTVVCMYFLRKCKFDLKTLQLSTGGPPTLSSATKTASLPNDILIDDGLQDSLLFSKSDVSHRPLLMSLMLQNASWQQLFAIKERVLSVEHCSNVNPTAALDFLSALVLNPRLWQGRDKSVSKHSHAEDIFHFDSKQVSVLIGYILSAAKSGPSSSNWKTKMQTHLNLLLSNGQRYVPHIRQYLSSIDVNKNLLTLDPYYQQLRLIIYMRLPCCGYENLSKLLPDSAFTQEICLMNIQCGTDRTLHCILSALTATTTTTARNTKDWLRKSQDLDLCARKLIATHPVLATRQLTMLAAGLKGRAQYEWSVLRTRGHLQLFAQVMGFLELLQPIVFEFEGQLFDVLDSYFALVQYQSHGKECQILTQRLLVLLQNWLANDVATASKYLKRHSDVLRDLESHHPPIKCILSSISLPISSENSTTCRRIQGVPPSTQQIATLMGDPLPRHWPQLVASLNGPNDCFATLQELEHLTHKKPHLLNDIVRNLYRFLDDSSGSTRSAALLLILRWFKYKPASATAEVLPIILMCLNSGKVEVVDTILERLPELVALMQGAAGGQILCKVFDLGVDDGINVVDSICKTINLLKLQSGV